MLRAAGAVTFALPSRQTDQSTLYRTRRVRCQGGAAMLEMRDVYLAGATPIAWLFSHDNDIRAVV